MTKEQEKRIKRLKLKIDKIVDEMSIEEIENRIQIDKEKK